MQFVFADWLGGLRVVRFMTMGGSSVNICLIGHFGNGTIFLQLLIVSPGLLYVNFWVGFSRYYNYI